MNVGDNNTKTLEHVVAIVGARQDMGGRRFHHRTTIGRLLGDQKVEIFLPSSFEDTVRETLRADLKVLNKNGLGIHYYDNTFFSLSKSVKCVQVEGKTAQGAFFIPNCGHSLQDYEDWRLENAKSTWILELKELSDSVMKKFGKVTFILSPACPGDLEKYVDWRDETTPILDTVSSTTLDMLSIQGDDGAILAVSEDKSKATEVFMSTGLPYSNLMNEATGTINSYGIRSTIACLANVIAGSNLSAHRCLDCGAFCEPNCRNVQVEYDAEKEKAPQTPKKTKTESSTSYGDNRKNAVMPCPTVSCLNNHYGTYRKAGLRCHICSDKHDQALHTVADEVIRAKIRTTWGQTFKFFTEEKI